MTAETNKRKLGARAEQIVRKYLTAQGFEILEMNYRCKQGEIDIIAKEAPYLVFIEVKYRNTTQYGMPQEAVGTAKQRRICKVARYYLHSHNLGEGIPIRFDVAGILENQLTYLRDAFPFQM